MSVKTLTFKRHVTFTGRNGTFKCAGVELMECGDRVQISPITSKGGIGRCDIDIPNEDIAAFIDALTGFHAHDLDELLANADNGDTEALDKLESFYPEMSHDGDCTSRHGAGECNCKKNEIVNVLEKHGRDVP